jgi:hypothetical protein
MGSLQAARRRRIHSPRDPAPPGQALVEFALIAPVALFIVLGAVEAGMLVIAKADQDRATAVVASWAAQRPGDESWHAVAAHELPGCDVTVDDSRPGLLVADATCTYQPVATRGLWDGLPISSEESAVVREPAPTPTPEPSPSASG